MAFCNHFKELKPGIAEEGDLYFAAVENSVTGGLIPTIVNHTSSRGFSAENKEDLTVVHTYYPMGRWNQGILLKKTKDGRIEAYASPILIEAIRKQDGDYNELEGALEDAVFDSPFEALGR